MANKHSPNDLAQMQSLSLDAKILMSERRIIDWYDYWHGNVYISFSGGKDSTVLKHLVESVLGAGTIPVVFVDTGLEYPEVRRFATKRADVVLRPEMRFDEVIKTYGYPVISKEVANTISGAKPGNTRWLKLQGELIDPHTGKPSVFNIPKWGFMLDAPFKVSDKCCDIMKKRPAHKYEKETGRKPFLGLLACESLKRRRSWEKTGCNAYDKQDPQSQPMAFWTEQDILEYIKRFNLEYASVYGDIVENEDGMLKTTLCDRTGCIFCGFGCHMEKGENRFQRMKKTHPRQYDYCMRPVEEKGLGMREVLEYIGVPYE